MGSRCARHWMRRTAAGRRLREWKLWRTKYENIFAQGLDIRRGLLILGVATPSLMQYPTSVHDEWTALTSGLIAAFDKGIRDED